jgi:hypothetical protein
MGGEANAVCFPMRLLASKFLQKSIPFHHTWTSYPFFNLHKEAQIIVPPLSQLDDDARGPNCIARVVTLFLIAKRRAGGHHVEGLHIRVHCYAR